MPPRPPDRLAAAFLLRLALRGHQKGRVHPGHHPGDFRCQLAAIRHLLPGGRARVSVGVHVRHAAARHLQFHDQPHHLRLQERRDPALHLLATVRLLSAKRRLPLQVAQRSVSRSYDAAENKQTKKTPQA